MTPSQHRLVCALEIERMRRNTHRLSDKTPQNSLMPFALSQSQTGSERSTRREPMMCECKVNGGDQQLRFTSASIPGLWIWTSKTLAVSCDADDEVLQTGQMLGNTEPRIILLTLGGRVLAGPRVFWSAPILVHLIVRSNSRVVGAQRA